MGKKEWQLKFDTVSTKPKTALPLESYTGPYQHDIYGKLHLSREGDSLRLKLEHHPKLEGTLVALGGNRFVCTYNDPVFGRKVLFFIQSGNEVKSLILSVADWVEPMPYEFMKL